MGMFLEGFCFTRKNQTQTRNSVFGMKPGGRRAEVSSCWLGSMVLSAAWVPISALHCFPRGGQ